MDSQPNESIPEQKEKELKEQVNNNDDNNNNNSAEENENESDLDSSSHESIFYNYFSEKKEEEKEEKENINKINNIFLENKRKRELTYEQKEERIKRNIERYCKRNDRMLELLQQINNKDTSRKNINEMMRLLAIDLSDTKKLTNRKALISQRKKEMFNKLFELTFREYQLFWFQLTEGKYKKGNAQLINSSNISNARAIYNKIMEDREKERKQGKEINEKTVKDIINDRNNKDIESEKIDNLFLGYDSEISSDEDSLDSSIDESSSDNESNKKNEKEKEENIRKEKELKKKEEEEEKKKKEEEEKKKKEEEKEKNEKMKKFMEEEDEIDIFN